MQPNQTPDPERVVITPEQIAAVMARCSDRNPLSAGLVP